MERFSPRELTSNVSSIPHLWFINHNAFARLNIELVKRIREGEPQKAFEYLRELYEFAIFMGKYNKVIPDACMSFPQWLPLSRLASFDQHERSGGRFCCKYLLPRAFRDGEPQHEMASERDFPWIHPWCWCEFLPEQTQLRTRCVLSTDRLGDRWLRHESIGYRLRENVHLPREHREELEARSFKTRWINHVGRPLRKGEVRRRKYAARLQRAVSQLRQRRAHP